MLDPIQARVRQKRLLQTLHDRRLDAAVIGLSKHVYYFTAHLPFWQQYAGLIVFANGRTALVTANSPDRATAADSVHSYEASWSGTQRQEQPALVAAALLEILAAREGARIGIDTSAVTTLVASRSGVAFNPIDTEIWQMRRSKDPDELKLMRVGIECCRRMYERARQIIEPGVEELRVYGELHAVAIEVAGEPLSDYLGNDYACGAMGGPPRNNRAARAGELYILDLGPAYRGYFSDNARTFSVDRKPTDAQLKAWEIVTGAHPIVERMAKPGTRCQDIYAAADDHYRAATGKAFPHHLGHGVGLQPHEFPHLNPKWDDVLLEGEIFTAEPGMYGEELGGGMRIENQYLVTANGVENLTPFPKALA
jgi:Xaa-Pro aminopeptidase